MKPTLTIAVLVLSVLATCASCASALMPDRLRSPSAQWDASVLIQVSCIPGIVTQYGSGVVVSKDRVLTAMHVVKCDMGLDPTVTIDPGDGTDRDATVEVLLPDDDIARLRVSADLSDYFHPVEIGPHPAAGERACWTALAPRPTLRCGTTQPESAYEMSGIFVDGFVEHGNSGSGMYDSRGRLVGIVVSTLTCQTGVYCLGRAVSLAGREWLVP